MTDILGGILRAILSAAAVRRGLIRVWMPTPVICQFRSRESLNLMARIIQWPAAADSWPDRIIRFRWSHLISSR
jgi:hypothetical protein